MAGHLRIPLAVFAEMEALLRSAEPAEGGLFLLVGHAEVDGNVILLAQGIIPPTEDAWRIQGSQQLAPSTAWISTAIGLADDLRLGLAFVHSHPGELGCAEFSRADEWMHETLVPAMVANLDGRAFGSFVYASGEVQGAVWLGEHRHRVQRVTVTNARVREVGPLAEHTVPEDGFDRQVRIWGADGQAALGRMTIGVVGAGGTGSAMAEQLVRLGVGRVVLVDHDDLSRSNVTRVYGSAEGDAGRRKVDVVGDHLDRTRPGHVKRLGARVEEVWQELRGLDVLVGCTDSHASRALLNDLAVQYLVPLIDVGCRVVPTAEHGTFVPVEVRHVHPDGPCLWCMGDVLDGRQVRNERMPAEERAGLEREGYVSGLRVEPSVIPVTTVTATLGVLRLLGVVLGVVDYPGSRIIGDLRDLDFTFVADAIDRACVCRERRARGDLRPVR